MRDSRPDRKQVLRDFAPVSLLARFDLVLAVRAGARFATLAGLLDWARAHPGRLNMGTPQIGSTQHLAAELFKASAAIAAQVVPFNGTPQLMAALRGGEIDVLLDILGPLLPQFAAGALQPLAVLGAQRAAQLPAVPTVAESGAPLTGFDLSSWNGLAAPVHTPPAVIERLAHEVQAALARPDVRQRLLDLNLSPRSSSPQQLADQLAADVRRWRELIARAGIARL